MMALMLFLHLTAVTGFVGIVIASLFYVRQGLNQQDTTLSLKAFKVTLFADGFVLPFLATILVTGFYLAKINHFTLQIPWVFVAYVTFGCVSIGWLLNYFLKRNYFQAISQGKIGWQGFWWLYLFITTCMILLFLMMMHDAITRSTLFWWR